MDFINTFHFIYPDLKNTYTDQAFTYLNINQNVPKQGWKIHVSATYTNYFLILSECISCCIENDVDMKFLKNLDQFTNNLSKSTPRAYSGKFITIYPSTLEKFIVMCEKLYTRLNDFQGPYVLSDKRYKDCKVLYYRYGRCRADENESETERKQLICPDGSIIEDKRLPYYSQPPFVQDPFHDSSQQENPSALLNNRYKVETAVHYSNTGDVYLGTDTIGNRKVIIKEARPYIESSSSGDCIDMRKKEIAFFNLFPQYCPKVYDSFYEWEHYFTVVEFIEGPTLSEFSDRVVEEVYFDDLTGSYRQDAQKIIIELMRMIVAIHKFGITIHDISNTNIMLRDGQPVIIDFEGGKFAFEQYDYIVKTPGFDNGDHSIDRMKRDYVSLGLLIINLFIGTNQLAQLDQQAALETFYLFACHYQLDPRYYSLISNLLLRPHSTNLEIQLHLMCTHPLEAVSLAYNEIKENLLADDLSNVDKNAVHLIDSKSSSVDLTDLANEKELFILAYLSYLMDNQKITFTNNIDFSFEKIGHVNKTGSVDYAHLIILVLVMSPAETINRLKPMIHLWIQKLIGSQNQDGSFISEFDGVEGEGLLDGAAMIVCSLVEAYRFFREERILQSLTDWLNYTEKFGKTHFPQISKRNANKSPYLANGKAGMLLAKWYVLRSGSGTEAMKNETFEQIKELPLVSSNVSFGYGISGIAYLKVLTNNLKRNDYNSLLTNLLSYKVNFKGKNRYPDCTNSRIEARFLTGEIGVLFLVDCIRQRLEDHQ